MHRWNMTQLVLEVSLVQPRGSPGAGNLFRMPVPDDLKWNKNDNNVNKKLQAQGCVVHQGSQRIYMDLPFWLGNDRIQFCRFHPKTIAGCCGSKAVCLPLLVPKNMMGSDPNYLTPPRTVCRWDLNSSYTDPLPCIPTDVLTELCLLNFLCVRFECASKPPFCDSMCRFDLELCSQVLSIPGTRAQSSNLLCPGSSTSVTPNKTLAEVQVSYVIDIWAPWNAWDIWCNPLNLRFLHLRTCFCHVLPKLRISSPKTPSSESWHVKDTHRRRPAGKGLRIQLPLRPLDSFRML